MMKTHFVSMTIKQLATITEINSNNTESEIRMNPMEIITCMTIVCLLVVKATGFRIPNRKNRDDIDTYRSLPHQSSGESDKWVDTIDENILNFLQQTEHSKLREALNLATELLDDANTGLGDIDSASLADIDDMDMLVDVEYLMSMLKSRRTRGRRHRRSHSRRHAFDPIAYNAGLSGFEGYGDVTRQEKRPISFAAIQQFLANRRRRNSIIVGED